MKTFRRVEVGLAGLADKREIDTSGEAVGDAVSMLQKLDAPAANITVSMGYDRKGVLNFSAVRRFVEGFLGLFGRHEAAVHKLAVTGTDADGIETAVVDLIEDRMIESAEIELDRDRRLPYSRRRTALVETLARRRRQIERILRTRRESGK